MGADFSLRRVCHRQDIAEGEVRYEVLRGVVKHGTNGRIRAAHDAFHAIESAQHVGRADHPGAAAAHKQVLGLVGHTDHFVGHHLADGEDQVIFGVQKAPVEFHRNGVLHQAF